MTKTKNGPSPAGDGEFAAHAVVYFLCGALFGGGADVLVSLYWGNDLGQAAGLAGFVAGLLLARMILRRRFSKNSSDTKP